MYYVVVEQLGLRFQIFIKLHNQEGVLADEGTIRTVYGPIQTLDMAQLVQIEVRDSLHEQMSRNLRDISWAMSNPKRQKSLIPPQE